MMKLKYIYFILVFIFYIFSLDGNSLARTLNVPSDTYPTIQSALDAALSGDTILVSGGTYKEKLIWPQINGIKLIGQENENVVIDADRKGCVITISSAEDTEIIDHNTEIRNVTITNGSKYYTRCNSRPCSYSGSGIRIINTSPKISNVLITENSSGYGNEGGGVYCKNSNSVFEKVSIQNNESYCSGGGIFSENCSLNLTQVTIYRNIAGVGGGGGAFYDSTVELNKTIIFENETKMCCGGGLKFINSAISLKQTKIFENKSSYGGGLYLAGQSQVNDLDLVDIFYNISEFGGGIFSSCSVPIELYSIKIYNNSAEESGGGIYSPYSSSSITLKNVSIYNNRAMQVGGGLSSTGLMFSIYITGCNNAYTVEIIPQNNYLKTNSATPFIFNKDDRCTIVNNTAPIGSDIYLDAVPNNKMDVFLKYFTDIHPTNLHAEPFDSFSFDILYEKKSPELFFVSPKGNDANNGQSETTPFQTINKALNSELSEGVFEKIIYLQEGIYSPETTGMSFPITLDSFVSIVGKGKEKTILDAQKTNRVFLATNVFETSISGLKIMNGETEENGAGIYSNNSSLNIKEVSFENHKATEGGAIYCEKSEANLLTVSITENNANNGSGLCSLDSRLTLRKVLIANNQSAEKGAAIYCTQNSLIDLYNNTIADNNAADGGGIYFDNSDVMLTSSILWGNTPNQISGNSESSSLTLSYSNIQNLDNEIFHFDIELGAIFEGENFDKDPMFDLNNNYALQFTSPCIDAGHPDQNLDPDQNRDNDQTRLDMGAFYCHQVQILNPDTSLTPNVAKLEIIDIGVSNYIQQISIQVSSNGDDTMYLHQNSDFNLEPVWLEPIRLPEKKNLCKFDSRSVAWQIGREYTIIARGETADNRAIYSIPKKFKYNPPEIGFTKANDTINEEEDSHCIEISLSTISSINTEFTFQTLLDTSAIEDRDFEYISDNRIIVEPGQLTSCIYVRMKDNHIDNQNPLELKIKLIDSDNASLDLGSLEFKGVITDSETAGFSKTCVEEVSITEGEYVSYTMCLTSEPLHDVTIRILSSDQAEIFNIFPDVLRFTSRNWSEPQYYTVLSIDNKQFSGEITATISFKTESVDTMYNDKYIQSFDLKVIEDEPEPTGQTTINCPSSPTNKQALEITWESIEDGLGEFRYKFKNDDWKTTSINNYEMAFPLDGMYIFKVKEKLNLNPEIWSTEDSCNTVIDNGFPCTESLSVTCSNNVVTINYLVKDIFACQKCGSSYSNCSTSITDLGAEGTGIKKVELWVKKPDDDEFQIADIDTENTIDNAFTYTLTQNGTYNFSIKASDKAGNYQEEFMKTEEILFSDQFSGYAVLAVGGIPDDENGKDSHSFTADNIYYNLVNRGFTMNGNLSDSEDHIKYYNPHRKNSNCDELIKQSYKDSLKETITVWAAEKMNKYPGPLYIILIDHGSHNKFFIESGATSGTIKSEELDNWILALENNLNGLAKQQDIIIFIGACFSGSFIDNLSRNGRIVITSAADNEVSYRGVKNDENIRDGSFFLTSIFNELGKGFNLHDSFVTAVQRTEQLTYSKELLTNGIEPFYDTAKQHPLLDDNGDQVGHNILPSFGDGHRSKKIILGYAIDEQKAITIEEANVSRKIIAPDTKQIDFTLSVNDDSRVEKAWIEIRTPALDSPLFTAENHYQMYFDMIQLPLSKSINDQFELKYSFYSDETNVFEQSGKYTIYFYVKSKDDIISGSGEIYVYKTKEKNNSPKPFKQISPAENDIVTELKDFILLWENTKDPDNDMVTYTLKLSLDKVNNKFIKEGINETFCFVNLSILNLDDSNVFWKVIATDEFGGITETDWRLFHTNNTNEVPATIYGQVFDSKIKKLLNSEIHYKLNESDTLKYNCLGTYQLKINNFGSLDMTVISEGYDKYTNSITIQEGERYPLFIPLKASSQGDLDQNGTIDLHDAFLCLQYLSGFQNYSLQENMFINNISLTLNDAIYIMKVLSQ